MNAQPPFFLKRLHAKWIIDESIIYLYEKCLIEKYENYYPKYITDTSNHHTGISHRSVAATCMSFKGLRLS